MFLTKFGIASALHWKLIIRNFIQIRLDLTFVLYNTNRFTFFTRHSIYCIFYILVC